MLWFLTKAVLSAPRFTLQRGVSLYVHHAPQLLSPYLSTSSIPEYYGLSTATPSLPLYHSPANVNGISFCTPEFEFDTTYRYVYVEMPVVSSACWCGWLLAYHDGRLASWMVRTPGWKGKLFITSQLHAKFSLTYSCMHSVGFNRQKEGG